MGIMQYYSDEYINSEQSVILGIKKIKKHYGKLLEKYDGEDEQYNPDYSIKLELAGMYNTGSYYRDSIIDIWDKVLEKCYENTTDKLYNPLT